MSDNNFVVNVVRTATSYGYLHLGEQDKIVETESFNSRSEAKAYIRLLMKKYDLSQFGFNVANISTNLELNTNF